VAVGDFDPNDTTLPFSGRWGDGAGLGHVHRIALHRQPGRDDVAERDKHGDLAVECDPEHAVEVPIGDQEPATIGLQRVLESGLDVDLKRMVGGLSKLNWPMSATTVKLSGPFTQ